MDEIPDLLEVKKTRNIILKMEKSTILKSNQQIQTLEHLDYSCFLPLASSPC